MVTHPRARVAGLQLPNYDALRRKRDKYPAIAIPAARLPRGNNRAAVEPDKSSSTGRPPNRSSTRSNVQSLETENAGNPLQQSSSPPSSGLKMKQSPRAAQRDAPQRAFKGLNRMQAPGSTGAIIIGQSMPNAAKSYSGSSQQSPLARGGSPPVQRTAVAYVTDSQSQSMRIAGLAVTHGRPDPATSSLIPKQSGHHAYPHISSPLRDHPRPRDFGLTSATIAAHVSYASGNPPPPPPPLPNAASSASRQAVHQTSREPPPPPGQEAAGSLVVTRSTVYIARDPNKPIRSKL